MSGAAGQKIGRRKFIGAAAAAGLMMVKPQHVRGTAANSAVRLGLLGCGERGTHVATSFATNTTARVVALADLFDDQLQRAKQHFDEIAAKQGYAGVSPKLMFRGPKAYQEIAASKDIDMVQISTPDFFHAEHLAAVVAASKHCYCEKPTGVDVRSAKAVKELGKKAEGRLSLDIGFQIRRATPYVELVKRIHAGALGKIACASTYYHATAIKYPPRRPDASSLELRIRNFYWDRVLSGDTIVDQAIHVIDICNWVLGAHPLKAVGAGGRKIRDDWGDTWDHFDVIFTYPGDVRVSLNSVQFGDALWDVAERFFGSKGVAESHYSGVVGISGDEPWSWEGGGEAKVSTNTNIYALKGHGAEKVAGVFHDTLEDADAQKDKAFIESIVSGRYHNEAAQGAESTLSAILGRMAAYSGREVTWDEMLASDQHYDPELEGIDLSALP